MYPVRMLTVKGAYALLWQLSGKFERNVPGWEHSLVRWRARSADRSTGSVLLVSLCAGHVGRRLAMWAVVEIRHPGFPSTPRVRERVERVDHALRSRGYLFASDHLPEQPLLARREISGRRLAAEHRFLSALAGKPVLPLAGRVSDPSSFSRAISRSSSWGLMRSEWTMDREIRNEGRSARAHARVRIAPPPTKENSLTSEISVQVWLPWRRSGVPPKWLKLARMQLARQLRSGGLTVEWLRSEPGLVFGSRSLPRSAEGVMRLARHLG